MRSLSFCCAVPYLLCAYVAVEGAVASTNQASSTVDRVFETRAASIMGESALVDKETGRIFWEGGSSSTLSASVVPKIKTHLGMRHVKASLLSVILLLALAGEVASWLQDLLDQSALLQQEPRPFYLAAALLLFQWTVLRAPRFQPWFIASIVILYLMEAYFCNTRRYLANAIEGSEGIENYLECLRNTTATVEWKVRSFHYEMRRWTAPIAAIFQGWQSLKELTGRENPDTSSTSSLLGTSSPEPSWVRRKKVTQVATGSYKYKDCADKTAVGVWKRASPIDHQAVAFTKILLTKQLVLSDAKTRQDYFEQQSRFVTEHCQEDRMAEFSTNIRVDGYRPRLLATRKATGSVSSRFFRLHLFWVFTLLGLTVPYRAWFANHCDEIRVTVIKEISCVESALSGSNKNGWFSALSPRKTEANNTEDERKETFRSLMENLRLYADRQQDKDPLQQEELSDVLQSIESAAALAEAESISKTDEGAGEVEENDTSRVESIAAPESQANESES